MNKSESKYFHTAQRMDEALLSLLLEKDLEYVTVKELCDRSGVSRSTFYLHYEGISDLLEESLSMIHQQFEDSFSQQETVALAMDDREDLFFITDRWLLPWLNFVKENRRIYQAIHAQGEVCQVERTYEQFFLTVFSPILSRYGVEEKKHRYIMEFYRHGLMAVTMKWVEGDCREDAAEIAGIIKLCVGHEGDGKTK